ncbi:MULTISPECIES: hypothetical protein [Cupriavidus]|nr:hypothetical protein K2O51_09145 [Cupriavidus pinatubonensis]
MLRRAPPRWRWHSGQLAPGGTLIAPVGTRARQELVRITRDAHGQISREELGAVAFDSAGRGSGVHTNPCAEAFWPMKRLPLLRQ